MPFKKKHGHALTYVGLFFLFGLPLILTLLGGYLGGAVAGGGGAIIGAGLFGIVGIGISSGFGFLLLLVALIVRCVRS